METRKHKYLNSSYYNIIKKEIKFMKPSELIYQNYIIDLAEGLSDRQLQEFFDFCDKCFYVNSRIVSQINNLRKVNGKTLIKLNRVTSRLEFEIKELDLKLEKLQKLRNDIKIKLEVGK